MIRRPPRSTLFPDTTLFPSTPPPSAADTAAVRRPSLRPPPPHRGPGYRPLFSATSRSEEHTSELQSRQYLACRVLLDKKALTLPCSAPNTASDIVIPRINSR